MMDSMPHTLKYDLQGLVDVERQGSNLLKVSGMNLDKAATRLEEIAREVRFQAIVRKIYDRLTARGGILWTDTWDFVYGTETSADSAQNSEQTQAARDNLQHFHAESWDPDRDASEISNMEVRPHDGTIASAMFWLIGKKYASMDSLGRRQMLIVGPQPPEAHPLDLDLYEVDVGITYWLALPKGIETEDLPETVAEVILVAESGPVGGDVMQKFIDTYDDEPLTMDAIKLIDREKGIRLSCHVDDGRRFITMWKSFCETEEPGIIACSEW